MQRQVRMTPEVRRTGSLPRGRVQTCLPVAYYYPVSVGHGPGGRAEHGAGNT